MNISKMKSLESKHIFAFLSLLVLILYLRYVQKYGLNLPIWDDYNSGLNFLLQWKQASSAYDKWIALLQQSNEHRIVLTKLIELSYYWISGQINFKFLIWCGNLFLFLVIAVINFIILPSLADNRQKWPMFLIILSILLSPIQWEAQLWGMCGIESFAQILVSLLILYFFVEQIETKAKRSIYFLVVLNFLNLFIGGGFLAILIVLPILAIVFKRLKLSLLLLIYGVFLTWLYFNLSPYHVASYPPLAIKNAFIFFFSFWGGGVHFLEPLGSYLCPKLGFLFFMILLFYRKELQKNKLVFSWFFFCMVVDLLLVKTRTHVGAGQTGGSSKYAIYSLISFVFFVYSVLLPRINLRVLKGFAAVSFCFFIFCLNIEEPYKRYHENKRMGPYPPNKEAIIIYANSKKEGIYESEKVDKVIKKINSN